MAGTALSAMRFLGLASAPAATGAPRAAAPRRTLRPTRTRPPSRARSHGLHPLRWLGLAEEPIRVEGHPRMRERALETLHRRRRRDSVITGSLAIAVALVLLVAGVVRSPLMGVESVTVVGLPEARQQVVAAASRVTPGTNVLDVDLDRVQADVERLPWVASATVLRRLPSTVEIRVAARAPVAVAVHGADAYLVDGEGVVLARSEEPLPVMAPAGGRSHALPHISVAQAPVVGRVIDDPAALAAAQVAEAMPQVLDEWIVGYTSSAVGEVDATLRIDTEQGVSEMTVHLGRPDAIDAKAATLAALVDETIGRGLLPRVLDVRIPDRPVVQS